jgi:hypothetical protein
MSYLLKIGSGIAIVVALGSIVMIAARPHLQHDSNAPTADAPVPAGDQPTLTFPLKIVDARTPLLVEGPSPHAYDFWFENRNDVPIDLALLATSCRCADAAVCLFTPEEAKRYRNWLLAAGVSRTAAARAGILLLASALAIEQQLLPGCIGRQLEWHPVDFGVTPAVTVPSLHAGLFRLTTENTWHQEVTRRLALGLGTRVHDGSGRWYVQRLELSTALVRPLRVSAPALELGELRAGQEKTVTFSCWSSTRGGFSLEAHENTHDPCIQLSWTPLNHEQKQKLAAATNSPVLCGYEIRITLHERLSENVRMEWGRFARRLVLRSPDNPNETSLLLTGTVRGEVVLGEANQHDTLSLGDFPSALTTVKTIRLLSERPELELQWDRSEPAFLKCLQFKSLVRSQLARSDGKTAWDLVIEIPAWSCLGELPDSSAIYLKIAGDPPRRVRIPLTGVALP